MVGADGTVYPGAGQRGGKGTLEGDESMYGDWLVVRSRGGETLRRPPVSFTVPCDLQGILLTCAA